MKIPGKCRNPWPDQSLLQAPVQLQRGPGGEGPGPSFSNATKYICFVALGEQFGAERRTFLIGDSRVAKKRAPPIGGAAGVRTHAAVRTRGALSQGARSRASHEHCTMRGIGCQAQAAPSRPLVCRLCLCQGWPKATRAALDTGGIIPAAGVEGHSRSGRPSSPPQRCRGLASPPAPSGGRGDGRGAGGEADGRERRAERKGRRDVAQRPRAGASKKKARRGAGGKRGGEAAPRPAARSPGPRSRAAKRRGRAPGGTRRPTRRADGSHGANEGDRRKPEGSGGATRGRSGGSERRRSRKGAPRRRREKARPQRRTRPSDGAGGRGARAPGGRRAPERTSHGREATGAGGRDVRKKAEGGRPKGGSEGRSDPGASAAYH